MSGAFFQKVEIKVSMDALEYGVDDTREGPTLDELIIRVYSDLDPIRGSVL